MANRDWFRSETWSPEIEDEFEKRLKRSRTRYNKAQYLKIQGNTLLTSLDCQARATGVELLRRVIAEYPGERSETAHSHELLANYFKQTKDFLAAEAEYRELLAYYSATPSRTNTSGLADLSFVELILEWGVPEKYKDAEHLLDLFSQVKGRHIIFNSDVFRYHTASARLLAKVGRQGEAAAHAAFALKALNITTPQFSRHPNVGVAHASEKLIEELINLAGVQGVVLPQ